MFKQEIDVGGGASENTTLRNGQESRAKMLWIIKSFQINKFVNA